MRKLTDQTMARMLRESIVKDAQGNPLRVFRGEHGETDSSKRPMQTLLGSLSFGDAKTASTYAMSPNDSRMTAKSPVVYPAYLIIRKPFIEAPDDPFIDYVHLEKHLGREVADQYFLKYADHAENTNNWCDEINSDNAFSGVKDFHARHPERMSELYMNLYPLLDDSDFIAVLKLKGFDGAVHCGSGENGLETEYRVFDESSVIFALSKEASIAVTNQKERESPSIAA